MGKTKKSFKIDYKNVEVLFLEAIESIETKTNLYDFKEKSELFKETIIKEYEKKILSNLIKSNDDDKNNAIININSLDDLMNVAHKPDKQPKLSDEDEEKISAYLTERIEAYLSFGSFKKMTLCQRYFARTYNKSFDNAVNILKILLMSEQLTLDEINDNEYIESLSKLIINDALKILRCNNLIQKNKDHQYHTLKEEWFEKARYKIKDTEILQNLAKPLLSFVRVNIHDEPFKFFTVIDELIKYILQTSSNHNANFELEKAIYETIASYESITIILKDTGESIEIFPSDINIVFDKNKAKKTLNYSPIDNEDEEKTIDLSKISLYSLHNANQTYSSTSAYANQNVSNYATFSINQDSIKQKEIKKTDAILAVNYLLYEYFENIDVFEEMEIITDLTYIETLQMEYIKKNRTEFKKLIFSHDSLTPSADLFLLRIKDDYDFIAQEIQKNLEYIKVIYPASMNDTIKENMTVFLKNELL